MFFYINRSINIKAQHKTRRTVIFLTLSYSFTLFVNLLVVLEFSNIFTGKRQASFISLQAYFPPPSRTLLLLVFFFFCVFRPSPVEGLRCSILVLQFAAKRASKNRCGQVAVVASCLPDLVFH